MRARRDRPSTCWCGSTTSCSRTISYLVRMEPGIQTPETTLENGERLVPRLGLAAGADPAPPRHRRALRLGLPDPARRRPEAARRPGGHRPRLHRPARVGRGLHAGRGLDRPRPDLGPARRRGPHPARVHRDPGSAAPVTGFTDPCEIDVRLRDDGHAHPRGSARHQALHRRAVEGDRRARRGGRPRARRRRRAPHAGRRAHVRLHRRHGRRRVELHRAVAGASSSSPTQLAAAAARALRARRRCCTSARASGTRASRCRAGRSASSGARTACRCGAIRALLADPRRRARRRSTTRARFAAAIAERLGAAAPTRDRRLRGRPVAARRDEAKLPVERRSAEGRHRRKPGERARLARAAAGAARQAGGLRAAAARRRAREAGRRAGRRVAVAAAARAAVPAARAIRRWAIACRSARCRRCCPRTRSASSPRDPFDAARRARPTRRARPREAPGARARRRRRAR